VPPLNDLYFAWLYKQVASVESRNLARTYWKLLRILFTKEYIWSHPRDENRALEGINLRREFVGETNSSTSRDPGFFDEPCDMLELLVVLVRKLAYDDLDERPEEYWFHELLNNLGLSEFTDARLGDENVHDIQNVLDIAVNQRYPARGKRNTVELFPLSRGSRLNSQETELLIKAEAYLAERS
jgi:hypothetical protein